MPTPPSPTPERATKSMQILHAGMLVILAAFGVGGWVYIGSLDAPEPGTPSPTFESITPIFVLLGVISVAMLAMIPVIRSKVMPVIPPGLTIRPQDMDRAVGTLLGKWGNANLISWALAMSVGLYGVVVAAMLQDIWPYPVFATPAALVLFYYRPRLEEAQSLVDRVKNADTQ